MSQWPRAKRPPAPPRLAPRLARTALPCVSSASSSTRRMRACCATERPSLSRRRHSPCCARSCGKPGSLLTKNALLDQVWGHQFVSDSVLKTAISELRTVLDDDARQPALHRDGVAARLSVHRHRRASAAPQRWAGVPRIGSLPAQRLHRPRRSAFAASQCLGSCVQRQARDRLDRRRTGYRQDDADRAFRCGPRRRRFASAANASSTTAAASRTFRFSKRSPSCAAATATPCRCCARSRRRGCCSCRGSAPRRSATLCGASSRASGPDRMLREMGELLDRYTERRPLLAGDRGSALERPRDDPAHRLHRATARQRAPHVACKLSSRRGRRAGSSAQSVAARAASARPVRGDRARSVLRDGGRRVRGGSARRRSPRDEAFVRALHERTDGVPLFVASVMSEITARGAQSARQDAAAQAREDRGSGEPGGDHRPLHRQARRASSARCSRRRRFAASNSASTRSPTRWSATPPRLADICEELAARAAVARRRAWRRRRAMRRSCRIRSGTRSSARCCTSAPSPRRGRSSTARSAPRSNESAPRACRSAAGELALHFERGGEPMSALRYYAEAAEAALLHFSPAECMSLTERGLTLLDQAPQGPSARPRRSPSRPFAA